MKAVILDMPQHWLDERKRSGAERFDEMWEGVLHVSPSPNRSHQDLVLDLAMFLKVQWARPKAGRAIHEINVVHPDDVDDWINNYRIPDVVLLSPDRLVFDKNTYILGAPLVCIEVRSPRDESYEKLDFYIRLGVPEVWIIDRDTKEPTVFALVEGNYRAVEPDADGWIVSDAVGARMRATPAGKLAIRLDSTGAGAELPD
jgi:Uma2 family endonuclease